MDCLDNGELIQRPSKKNNEGVIDYPEKENLEA